MGVLRQYSISFMRIRIHGIPLNELICYLQQYK